MAKNFLTAVKVTAIFCFVAFTAVFAARPIAPNLSSDRTAMENFQTGAELFEANCARCHGSDGKGGKGPNLASEKRQAKWKESDEKLVKKITNGGFIMPSFKKRLNPEEIKAIADFVRTLKE